MNSQQPVAEEIKDYEKRLRAAQAASDVSILDALIADDLVFVDASGHIATKAMDLQSHREGALKIASSQLKDEQIRILGEDAAVAIVLLHLVGTYEGAPFEGDFRYTRVWQRQPQGWRIVAGHMSALAGS